MAGEETTISPQDPLNILIANGVNLDLLGVREPEIYGKKSLQDLESYLKDHIPILVNKNRVELTFFHTNNEYEFLSIFSPGKWDGAVINPGAWGHTSLALADRLAGIALPFVEVHLSNLSQREGIRQQLLLAPHAMGVIYGLGFDSYLCGVLGLVKKLLVASYASDNLIVNHTRNQ